MHWLFWDFGWIISAVRLRLIRLILYRVRGALLSLKLYSTDYAGFFMFKTLSQSNTTLLHHSHFLLTFLFIHSLLHLHIGKKKSRLYVLSIAGLRVQSFIISAGVQCAVLPGHCIVFGHICGCGVDRAECGQKAAP